MIYLYRDRYSSELRRPHSAVLRDLDRAAWECERMTDGIHKVVESRGRAVYEQGRFIRTVCLFAEELAERIYELCEELED